MSEGNGAGNGRPDPETMAAELSDAIAEGRLQLYYQPVVSLRDRVASEVEALPRWPREEEILAPSDFIEVAAQYELLPRLECWAIREAFGQLGRWRRATDLDISLNLSEDHVYTEALVGEIREAAQRHDVATRRISLEVSESALIEADSERLQRLRDLIELGVGMTIDDFSGRLPDDLLDEIPATAVKMSRRVVAGIPDSPTHTETATTVLRRAGEREVRVIANGIESPGQLAALRDMGCEYGQGFFFSLPMPADVLAERAMPR